MRKLKGFLLFLVFLMPVTLQAEIKEYTLDNGLKLIISEDHKVPLATFEVWYRVGSRDELSGKTGLSHLLEHMMFKGTPLYGSKTFSKIIQRNGGIDNAMTSKDYTMYFNTLSSDRTGISIDLEADRMANLLLDSKETSSEINVVMEERRMRYDNDPQNLLFETVVATAIKTHPYRRPVIGWMPDIASTGREDLYVHYKKFYSPDNAFIVLAGDVKPAEMLEKITATFGGFKKSGLNKEVVTKEPEQNGEKRVYLKKEAELPYLMAAYHTPSFPHEDSFALEALSTILSGGKSARLYKALVYEKKLALDAGSEYSGMYRDPFLFVFWATAAPGREIAEVERALYSEMEGLKNAPPSDKELQKAKNQIEASFIFGQDSLYLQAMNIGSFEMLGSWRLMDKYLEGIRKVTPRDIQEAAKKYLTEDNRTVGILVPAKAGRSGQ